MRQKRWRRQRVLRVEALLKLLWRNITDRRVSTCWIIPRMNPTEDCRTCLVSSFEVIPIQHLTFQSREERLRHRIIEAIADATHGRPHTEQRAAPAERNRGVLAAVIG